MGHMGTAYVMAVLANSRHERFAQLLAEGKTADEAYQEAGFSANRGNATRLKANESVQVRVAELLGSAAERTEITRSMIAEELAKIGFANMQDYMKVGADGDPYLDFSNLTAAQAAALAEVTVEDFKEGRGEDSRDIRRVKFKLHDKKGALVDLAKLLGFFVEKREIAGTIMVERVERVIIDSADFNSARLLPAS